MQPTTALPGREGPRPQTTSRIPHSQVDQTAPVELQEALWTRMRDLAGVEIGPSEISVPGARATFVAGDHACGPHGSCMIGREFAHIHPHDDGSLHVTLPDAIRREAIEKGWAEPHLLAGTDKAPETVVMLYGPRDADELETVWSLVAASHAFAMGEARS